MNKQTVAVIGLGKIGLTLAAVYATNNYNVIGCDVNEDVVQAVNAGKSHIDNEPGLPELVKKAHDNQTLRATTNTSEAVSKSSIVVVIVPVLIDSSNDVSYTYIDSATEAIGKGLQKGTTVIYETTLPTGDTRERFGRKLEELSQLKMGSDFYLAYSPERVYSNTIIRDLKLYPKIVGGVNEESLIYASTFYRAALQCEVLPVESTETAEFAKVAECVYRDVNIALANELAVYADECGVNLKEAANASNTQPFSHIHAAGIGVGGHCIPIYPYFFISRGLKDGIIQESRKTNDDMASYALSRIEKQKGSLKDSQVLILGLSYRENVKETEKSTTWLLINQLESKGANVSVNDPHYDAQEFLNYGVKNNDLSSEAVKDVDVIILQANHQEYKTLDFNKFQKDALFFDGRNAFHRDEIISAGLRYDAIGGAKS
ncbi:nucleotide sugar dehydrogenase [Bacillaceae bacterium JMAK1]|nr:nucleotide sugar dehydrogenase [Bacillaceae bacterium JMAK1]